ncbi:MAG: esterase family protein [Pyrinomonadaceae bacterium]|nr:esterase family protein [Pyrinomonadaceae bacterium]
MLKKINLLSLIVFLFVLIAPVFSQNLSFKVKIDASIAQQPLSGRLLIFMTNNPKPLEGIDPDFTNPEAVYITGMEVSNFDANKIIEVNPEISAFPRAFSKAPAGNYQIMALLDQDHSYTYDGAGAGDIYSPVTKITLPAGETELTLSKQVPERKNTIKNIQVVEFESPMLSAFWGRPIKMQASILLPPSYDKSKTQKYPTVYNIHGYGGSHLKAFGAPNVYKEMEEGKRPEVINVFLNAQCPLGHHVFADSVNNGPWGTALVNEFIPYLEKQFRMDAKPSGRFLTGHSSGGWATLWVMITHPDFFGGTWSTSPDPVDFRSFTGPDITKYPPQNIYQDAAGKDYNLVRMGGKELMSLRQYAQQELVTGYTGGQMASFNAVFSPKGFDGQPMKLFDVESGRIDPFVQKAWEKYDISRLLRENWKTLGPKLKGKLHIMVGTADTFHLDEAVHLLDAELKKLGSDAKIEYLEGRDHFNLYDGGLSIRITKEIYDVARPKAKAAVK